MIVKQIIKKYLKENNYDGLCRTDDCCCGVDLMDKCKRFDGDCKPGYKYGDWIKEGEKDERFIC